MLPDDLEHGLGVGGLFQGLAKIRAMQEFGDVGQGVEMLLKLALRDEKQHDEINRLVVERVEIDAFRGPAGGGRPASLARRDRQRREGGPGHRDAVVEAQDLINRNPNNLEARRLLGRIYLRSLGDMQAAVKSLARLDDWIDRIFVDGLVNLVATDAHGAAQRAPRLSAAIEALSAELGPEFARRVCLVNPLLVFEGQTVKSEVPGRR